MKRCITSILALAACFALTVSCSNGKASKTSAQSASPAETDGATATQALAGKIAYIEEPVLLARNGAESAPGIGDPLMAGDVLTTGANGRCTLELTGIGSLEMEDESVLRIDGVLPEEKRGAVSVLGGATAAKIGKLARPDAFVIRCGSVVCGVRGTEFRVAKDPTGKVSLSVQKGTVSMFPDALVTSGLHPSATLVGVSADTIASPETMDSILKELPTVDAGGTVEVPAEAFSSAEKEIEEAADQVKKNAAESREERLMKALKDIREIVSNPALELPVEPDKQASAIAETAPVEAEPAVATPATPAPVTTAPETGKAEDVPTVKSVPKKLAIRKGSRNNFSYTVTPIIPPALGEESGDFWPRPAPVRMTAADKAVRSPMSASNTSLTVNKDVAGKAKASFEEGRALMEVTKISPKEWVALVEPTAGVSLKKDAVYLMEFTAWAPESPMRLYACINEGGLDVNKDGNAFSPYISSSVPVGKEPKKYGIVYQHTDADNPDVNYNVSAGSTAGRVFIQDLTIREAGSRPGIQKAEPGNLIRNGDFSRGFLGWEALNNAENDLSSFSITGGRFRYRRDSPHKEAWLAQLCSTVPLKKSQRYRVSFDARFSGTGLLNIGFEEYNNDINRDGDPFTREAPYLNLDSKDDSWFRYTADFNATATDPHARITLNLGGIQGSIQIDNLRFEER